MRSNVIVDERTQEIREETPAPPVLDVTWEGGGARGLVYSGVVEVLDEMKLLPGTEYHIASSIGNLASLLIALDYSNDEIQETLKNVPYKSFLEGKNPYSILQVIISVFWRKNLFLSSGKKLEEWIEKIVVKKLKNKDATFGDLEKLIADNKKNGTNYKYLSVAVSNITKNCLEIINHITKPTAKIARTMLMSCSYPGTFPAVEWEGCLYLDGGLMNNGPSFYFNDKKFVPLGFTLNEKGANPGSMHVKVDTSHEMGLLWNNYKTRIFKTMMELVTAILYGMQSRDGEIREQNPLMVLQNGDGNFDTFQDFTPEEKELMHNAGREGSLTWLRNHYRECFEVIVHKSEADYLASLAKRNVNNIIDLKNYYQERLTEITGESQEDLKNKKLLTEKIASLTQYFADFTRQLNHPEEKIELKVTPHINVYVKNPREHIDAAIKKDIETRLQLVADKMQFLTAMINDLRQKISDNIERLQDSLFFDEVIYLNILEEEIKVLRHAKHYFLVILNIPDPMPQENPECKIFHNKISELLTKQKTSHVPLLRYIENHFREMLIDFHSSTEAITLNLGLPEDFKLYIMACMLYLKFSDCTNKEVCSRIEGMYESLFPQIKLPTSLQLLAEAFEKESSTEMILLGYRVERLIKIFAGIDKPKDKLKFETIKLDDVFCKIANPVRKPQEFFCFKKSKDKKENETENEIEMKEIYRPFAYNEKFLMFHKISGKNMNPHEDQLPKYMRRLT